MKELPVPIELPPVEFEYQFIVPALALASKLTTPVPQRASGVVEIIVGIVFTMIVTAGASHVCVPFEMIHETDIVDVGLIVMDELDPPTFHA